MNYDWKKLHFDDDFCNAVIETNQNGNIIVKGNLKLEKSNVKLVYWAANPADKIYSVSGSGLPFSSPDQAFSDMVNVGSLITNGKSFEFKLYYPNSYYVGLGSVLVHPQVYIKVCDPDIKSTVQVVKLGNPLPYKSLTHPLPPIKNYRHDVMFYQNNELTIRSQEQILRDSAYPLFNVKPPKMPDNFWGLKPPC
tara:strand:- start:999 stop:1580 length:582 start_codon:yes stop_codon:yes gene_type:complete